jgi:transcriptional regulator with XRE-family HTH domain
MKSVVRLCNHLIEGNYPFTSEGSPMRRNLRIAIVSKFDAQRVVARAAGLSEGRLSNIIQCVVTPRPDECEALAAVLGMPLDGLFTDDAPQAVPPPTRGPRRPIANATRAAQVKAVLARAAEGTR